MQASLGSGSNSVMRTLKHNTELHICRTLVQIQLRKGKALDFIEVHQW